jgi:hypothetical protein
VNNLDRVNGLGDASLGFVWRLQTDDGDATALRPFPDPDIIVNLTVWESSESLRALAAPSAGGEVSATSPKPPSVEQAGGQSCAIC